MAGLYGLGGVATNSDFQDTPHCIHSMPDQGRCVPEQRKPEMSVVAACRQDVYHLEVAVPTFAGFAWSGLLCRAQSRLNKSMPLVAGTSEFQFDFGNEKTVNVWKPRCGLVPIEQ